MMRAGSLNQRILIERRVTGEDSVGQPENVWIHHASTWANVRIDNGRETVASARESSIVAGSMRIRFRKDITAGMRVLWSDLIFNIKAVLPDGAKREHVDLVVESGANNG